MTHDEMIAVIQAHKDGRFIQVKHVVDGIEDSWNDADSPRWDFKNFDYRIKPEPRILLVLESNTKANEVVYAGFDADKVESVASVYQLIPKIYKEVLP